MIAGIKVSHPATKGFWEIPVLYEDEAILALDKPASLRAVAEQGGAEAPDLASLLQESIQNQKPWAVERNLSYLRNAHRVDFGVSGVLLFSKSQAVHATLSNAFGSEQPIRRYLAVVQGSPEQDRFEMDARIGQHPEDPNFYRVDSRHGKKSRTSFEVIERFAGWTMLACLPQPDRPHQARVHLRYKRLPIVGDPIYRGGNLRLSSIKPGFRLKPNDVERPLMVRPALHLEAITLAHPITGAELQITAPIPRDINVALKYLRKYARGGSPPHS